MPAHPLVQLDGDAQVYCAAGMAYPAVKEWVEAAKNESWLIESAELGKQSLSADPRHRPLDDRSAEAPAPGALCRRSNAALSPLKMYTISSPVGARPHAPVSLYYELFVHGLPEVACVVIARAT